MDDKTRSTSEVFDFGQTIELRDPDEILEEIKAERRRMEDQMRQEDPLRFLEKDGKRGYICPICGSGGHGKHNTGIRRKVVNGVPRYTCYAQRCVSGGDIFELIGIKYGITSFAEQVKKCAQIYGYDLDAVKNQAKTERKTYIKTECRDEEEMDQNVSGTKAEQQELIKTPEEPEKNQATPTISFKPWYMECLARVDKTDYWTRRGIGIENPGIMKKFWLGYDPAYKSGKNNNYLNKVVVIPTSHSTYVCRNTNDNSEHRFFKTEGIKPILFNTKAAQNTTTPLIVTETEIDALSFIEIGGNAMGLGGTGNADLFIAFAKEKKPRQQIILALDNDKAGDDAAEKILAALKDEKDLKIYNRDHFTNGLYGECKDANELLVKDRSALKAALEEIRAVEAKDQEAAAEEYRDKFSTAAYMNDFQEHIIDSINTPVIKTGYDKLDEILEGGLYPELYMLGAISSLGKTTFALQMADQIAAQGHDVIIFSLEMARSELIAKSISRKTYLEVISRGLSTKKAKTVHGITDFARWEHYDDDEQDVIDASMDWYRKIARHIFIVEALADIGVAEIRDRIDQHMRATGKRPVCVIDYLQIMKPAEIRQDVRMNTDANVKNLKRTSRDFNIPIIAISAINRENYTNEISMSAFKESGGIEYGAGVLLGLQLKGVGRKDFDVEEAKKKDPREIELKILKNRNAPTGDKINFLYYPKFNYIREADDVPEKSKPGKNWTVI